MRVTKHWKRRMLSARNIPRLANGGIALCHDHQLGVLRRGGLDQLLASILRKMARHGHHSKCPHCGSSDARRLSSDGTYAMWCSQCRKKWGHKKEKNPFSVWRRRKTYKSKVDRTDGTKSSDSA